jgi:uncharacterized membrane protein YphA (DoxX/SURF4 family)
MLCRILLGTLWLILGAAKILEPRPFLRYFASGLGVPAPLAWCVVGLEVSLGLTVICLGHTRLGRAASVASLVVVSLITLHVFFHADPGMACGCFGGLIRATTGRRLVVLGAIAFLSVQHLRSCEVTPVHAGAGD